MPYFITPYFRGMSFYKVRDMNEITGTFEWLVISICCGISQEPIEPLQAELFDPDKARLGGLLFVDKRLSSDENLSCALSSMGERP